MAWAWRFTDSFDHYSSSTALAQKWARGSTSTLSGSGFSISAGALTISSGSALYYGPNVRHIGVHFQAKRDSNTSRTLVGGYRSFDSAPNYDLVWKADGTFELFNQAGVSQGSSTLGITDSSFHFFEFFAKIDSFATFVLHIDGTTYKTWTSVDSQAAGTGTTTDQTWFGGNNGGGSGANFTIDNVAIEAGTVSDSPVFYNGIVIEVLAPNAAGAYEDWAPGGGADWSLVKEVPYSAGTEITFVNHPAATGADVYHFPLSNSTGSIYGMMPIIYGRRTAGTGSQIRVFEHDTLGADTVPYAVFSISIGGTTTRLYAGHDPNGFLPRTPAGMQAVQYGPDINLSTIGGSDTYEVGQFILELITPGLNVVQPGFYLGHLAFG